MSRSVFRKIRNRTQDRSPQIGDRYYYMYGNDISTLEIVEVISWERYDEAKGAIVREDMAEGTPTVVIDAFNEGCSIGSVEWYLTNHVTDEQRPKGSYIGHYERCSREDTIQSYLEKNDL